MVLLASLRLCRQVRSLYPYPSCAKTGRSNPDSRIPERRHVESRESFLWADMQYGRGELHSRHQGQGRPGNRRTQAVVGAGKRRKSSQTVRVWRERVRESAIHVSARILPESTTVSTLARHNIWAEHRRPLEVAVFRRARVVTADSVAEGASSRDISLLPIGLGAHRR